MRRSVSLPRCRVHCAWRRISCNLTRRSFLIECSFSLRPFHSCLASFSPLLFNFIPYNLFLCSLGSSFLLCRLFLCSLGSCFLLCLLFLCSLGSSFLLCRPFFCRLGSCLPHSFSCTCLLPRLFGGSTCITSFSFFAPCSTVGALSCGQAN